MKPITQSRYGSCQFLNFALECAITLDKRNEDGCEMNGKHQFLVYVDLHIRYGFVCVSKIIRSSVFLYMMAAITLM